MLVCCPGRDSGEDGLLLFPPDGIGLIACFVVMEILELCRCIGANNTFVGLCSHYGFVLQTEVYV